MSAICCRSSASTSGRFCSRRSSCTIQQRFSRSSTKSPWVTRRSPSQSSLLLASIIIYIYLFLFFFNHIVFYKPHIHTWRSLSYNPYTMGIRRTSSSLVPVERLKSFLCCLSFCNLSSTHHFRSHLPQRLKVFVVQKGLRHSTSSAFYGPTRLLPAPFEGPGLPFRVPQLRLPLGLLKWAPKGLRRKACGPFAAFKRPSDRSHEWTTQRPCRSTSCRARRRRAPSPSPPSSPRFQLLLACKSREKP